MSTAGQPIKPILPVERDNTYAANQLIAGRINDDSNIYDTATVNDAKADTAVSTAKVLVTRSNDPKAISLIERLTVARPTVAETEAAIDLNYKDFASQPGFGSHAQQVDAFLLVQSVTAARVDGYVNARTSFSNQALGFVMAEATRFQVTSECNAVVCNSFYQIVDFRWGTDTATPVFARSGNAAPFPLIRNNLYLLAVRVRITTGGVLIGNDWELHFSTTAGPVKTWVKVAAGEHITHNNPVNAPYTPFPDELPVARFVTSPGTGKPLLAPGLLATASGDDQSPRIIEAVLADTETEVVFCLRFAPGAPTVPYYFRVISTNDTTTDKVFHPRMSGPWATTVT